MLLDEDSIVSLSPDAQSLSGGRKLSAPSHWPLLGSSSTLLWGECQGSGKDPYRISVELEPFGYKCSCPSRKFPCKHVLGLLLLRAHAPQHFSETTPAEWVTAWSAGRNVRQKEKDAPVDKKAQAKRASARLNKIEEGIGELRQFLEDLIRQGISDLPARRGELFERIAARMTDAQAPGFAFLLQQLRRGIDYSDERWPSHVLEHLSKITLLIEAFERRDTLSPSLAAEARTLVGIPQNQEELRSRDGIKDRWAILGHSIYDEGTIIRDTRWVYGEASKQYGCFISYSMRGQAPQTIPSPGDCIEGEAVFFEAAYPLRLLFKSYTLTDSFPLPEALPTIASALDRHAIAISKSPWVEGVPCYIKDLLLIPTGDKWFMRDSVGAVLPVPGAAGAPSRWHLLAHQGSLPSPYFALVSPYHIIPFGLAVNGTYFSGPVRSWEEIR